MDDSYTPHTLAIRAGTGPSDLQDIRIVNLDKPDGWVTFDVSAEENEDGDALWVKGLKPTLAYFIYKVLTISLQ